MTRQTTTASAAADQAAAAKDRTADSTPPRNGPNRPAIRGAKVVAATTGPVAKTTSRPPRQSRAAGLRARLAEPGGVSLAALTEATAWQAHGLQAALAGLRQAGLAITRRRDSDTTIPAIDADGSAPSARLARTAPALAGRDEAGVIDKGAPPVLCPALGDEAACRITAPGQGGA